VTVHERVASARQRLRQAGLGAAEADLSARLLAEHLLGWTTERFVSHAVEMEPAGFAEPYDALISRRATREPLAYIVGVREFWGLALEVTPDVLIPRPETELIVEAALGIADDPAARLRVADIGTGSGCLAIALAFERPAWTVVATDISNAALAVARRNADRHRVSARIKFAQADLMEGIDGPFDLIVANPPYVRVCDRLGLQPEVTREPSVALYGGSDGLDLVGRLLAEAPGRMRPNSHVIFEFGYGQEVEIENLVGGTPDLVLVELRRDLQGIARTAVVRTR
jgi:release factor glutamine methyltransferase